MCEAKQATITRPSASAKIWWKAWPTIDSEAVEPGVSALLAELGERVDVGDAPVDRRVVELVIAGDYDGADVGPDHDRQGVRNAVAHGHERELEGPEAEARRVADLVELDRLEEAVLVELGLDERQREAAAVHRPVQLLEHERKRPVVVLVPVGDDEGEHVVAALEQPGDVGEDEVNAQHLVARELDATIDDHDL